MKTNNENLQRIFQRGSTKWQWRNRRNIEKKEKIVCYLCKVLHHELNLSFSIEPRRKSYKRDIRNCIFFFLFLFFIICFFICLLCKTFSNLLLAAPLITGYQRPLLPHLLKCFSLDLSISIDFYINSLCLPIMMDVSNFFDYVCGWWIKQQKFWMQLHRFSQRRRIS